MAKSSMEFECECGIKTVFDFTLPEVFKPTFQDVTCRHCQSVWEARFRRDLASDRLKCSHRLKLGSRTLGEVLIKRKEKELANRPQKKPQIHVIPEMPKALKQ